MVEIVDMTTLAEDIKALMALGHSLSDATQLAINDRARNTGKFQMSHAQTNIPICAFERISNFEFI